jgi:hypothetical protein
MGFEPTIPVFERAKTIHAGHCDRRSTCPTDLDLLVLTTMTMRQELVGLSTTNFFISYTFIFSVSDQFTSLRAEQFSKHFIYKSNCTKLLNDLQLSEIN